MDFTRWTGAAIGLALTVCAVVVLEMKPLVVLAAGQTETPYAATRLVGRWRAIMNNTLEESRAFAAEPVGDLMEIFVSPGAVRLVQDRANDEQMQKADAIVERFALAAVRAGEQRPDGSVIVEEASVEAAEKAICPVYPFCSQ